MTMMNVTHMHPSLILIGCALSVAFISTGCKHDDGQAVGTATIHSASTGGAPASATAIDETPDVLATPIETADRFAAALCRHDISCHEARWQLSTEALSTREADCINEMKVPAQMNIEQWTCEPAVARAGFKECLSAIANESCAAERADDGRLVESCRPAEICKRRAM